MEIGIELKKWIESSRIKVVLGHFGTGKTEVAVNIAMLLGCMKIPYILADLDVVDPYFRSREQKEKIEASGGILITSSQACMDADVPSMPAEVASVFDRHDRYAVMDIGGDPSGARVLAQYRSKAEREQPEVICVLNANRPLTKTAEEAAGYIHGIEAASGIRITGLINNTHLINETSIEDIERGALIAREVSEMTGIRAIGHSVVRKLAAQAEEILKGEEFILPMDIYMKRPWEV